MKTRLITRETEYYDEEEKYIEQYNSQLNDHLSEQNSARSIVSQSQNAEARQEAICHVDDELWYLYK